MSVTRGRGPYGELVNAMLELSCGKAVVLFVLDGCEGTAGAQSISFDVADESLADVMRKQADALEQMARAMRDHGDEIERKVRSAAARGDVG